MNDNGNKAKVINFADPKGELTSFDLFIYFIKIMQKRNVSGLSISKNGKTYSFSIIDNNQ